MDKKPKTAKIQTPVADCVLPFQLDGANARGRLARLDETLNTIIAQHDYPPPVLLLLAEAVMLSALIGQTIKLRWKLSLQIRGDGPIRLIATDYFAPNQDGKPAQIRAYASFDKDRLDANNTPTLAQAFAGIGQGVFAILLDQGQGTTPFKGITPLAGESLSACAQTYFMQSEQLPSRFVVSLGAPSANNPRWSAGGIMMQHLAASSDQDAGQDQRDEDWRRVNFHLDTLGEAELLDKTLPFETLIYRLFNEESPRIFPSQPIAFGCTCSRARVQQALSIYSAKDISKMTTEAGKVAADCQFCGAHYELAAKGLGFDGTPPKPPKPKKP